MITRYHARYYASLLTQKTVGGDIESLSQSLLSSVVDINPHQIDAALFAFKSPFNKDVSFWGTRPEFTESHVVFQGDENYLDIMFNQILL